MTGSDKRHLKKMNKTLRILKMAPERGSRCTSQNAGCCGDRPGDQGAKQQGGEIDQGSPRAQHRHRGQDLPSIVGCGAGDGYPEEGKRGQPEQYSHYPQRQQPAGERKGRH